MAWGSVPEWLMGADCKSAGYAYAGSNPAWPTITARPCGSVVEHTLGKGEVTSSILVMGFYLNFYLFYIFTLSAAKVSDYRSSRVFRYATTRILPAASAS